MFYCYDIYHQDILAWKQTKLKWKNVDYDKVIGISLCLNRPKKRKITLRPDFRSTILCSTYLKDGLLLTNF